jgi:hypothetical protein
MNILDRAQKEELRGGLKTRAAITALWATFVVLLICSVLFLPAYIIADSKLSGISKKEQINSESYEEHALLLNLPKLINQKAQFVIQNADVESAADKIIAIVNSKNGSIALSRISYQDEKKGKGSKPNFVIVVSGSALTREALLSFENTVRGMDFVESTSVPVGDFARDKDLKFTMAVNLKSR